MFILIQTTNCKLILIEPEKAEPSFSVLIVLHGKDFKITKECLHFSRKIETILLRKFTNEKEFAAIVLQLETHRLPITFRKITVSEKQTCFLSGIFVFLQKTGIEKTKVVQEPKRS